MFMDVSTIGFMALDSFNENMNQLNDWNIRYRYALCHDFECVQRVTSLYRVPAHQRESVKRQALLDNVYKDAIKTQDDKVISISVSGIKEMIRTNTRFNTFSNLKWYVSSKLKRFASLFYFARLFQDFVAKNKSK